MKKFIIFLMMTLILIGVPTNVLADQESSKHQFSDVKESVWFYPTVSKLVEKGLIGGYPDGTFKPQNNIKVSEFTKILMVALGYEAESPKGGHWAEGYIKKAKGLGIVKDGEFENYDKYITRGEMASMIVRAGESINDKELSLDIPENYKDYSSLIIDYSTLDSISQDIALKIFVSGIISGFPDGSFGFDDNATRAEACTILTRFLDKNQRKAPILPVEVDLSNTLTVEEFSTMLLEAIGQEPTMGNALSKGYVRYSSEYPTFDKPILRREAALTVARVMDDITKMPALFTSGKNDYFIQGYTLNHRLQPYQIDLLINSYGLRNKTHEEYFTLIYWHDYLGNIKDIRMITEEYLKEMSTLYFAGILDSDNQGRLRPYDFLTKEEAKELIDNVTRYDLKNNEKAVEQLARYVRNLAVKPMEEYLESTSIKIVNHRYLDKSEAIELELNDPLNRELWASIYPCVDTKLYEYPFGEYYDFASNMELEHGENLDPINNAFIHLNDYEIYARIAKNYMNARYNVDYRNLDDEAPFYSPIIVNEQIKKELDDYKTRVLLYFNPMHVMNGIRNENDIRRDENTWILPDDMIDSEIEKYKKYKIVSQAEFVTHDSLMYWANGSGHIRGTLRIIFYPPTDQAYLKEKGLEVGKWYEIDTEVLFTNAVLEGNATKYGERWAHSLLFYDDTIDLKSMNNMKLNDLLDFRSFRLMEELNF